jgi:hypothetical protein
MQRAIALLVASVVLANGFITPVQAHDGNIAAGLLGGLAAGTIIGAAVAGPRYYAPPPPYCYWTRGEPLWDEYRGVWTYPAVRVCQ